MNEESKPTAAAFIGVASQTALHVFAALSRPTLKPDQSARLQRAADAIGRAKAAQLEALGAGDEDGFREASELAAAASATLAALDFINDKRRESGLRRALQNAILPAVQALVLP